MRVAIEGRLFGPVLQQQIRFQEPTSCITDSPKHSNSHVDQENIDRGTRPAIDLQGVGAVTVDMEGVLSTIKYIDGELVDDASDVGNTGVQQAAIMQVEMLTLCSLIDALSKSVPCFNVDTRAAV